MATIEQIEAQDDTPLNALERELVRRILGINGITGDAITLNSELRIDGLTPIQCQMVRAYLNISLPEIEEDEAVILGGGSDGVSYDVRRVKFLIISDIRRMLYPGAANDPNLNPNFGTNFSNISQLPISYRTGLTEYL